MNGWYTGVSTLHGRLNSKSTMNPWRYKVVNIVGTTEIYWRIQFKKQTGLKYETFPTKHTKQNGSNKKQKFTSNCQNETTRAKFFLKR